MCIEKCLHFKRKCRHHPHPILDILPVYLTRGISTAGGLFVFQSSVFRISEKLHNVKQGFALTKTQGDPRFISGSPCLILFLQRIKCVAIFSSTCGNPNSFLPSSILFIKNVILRASVLIVCFPSSSISASPCWRPCMLFQY